MFTGIIEEVGSIARIDQDGDNRRIVIEARNVTRELRSGDSCAVSGVCLTALDITPTSFAAISHRKPGSAPLSRAFIPAPCQS